MNRGAFILFCVWTFVLVSRPQDLFPALAPLRPALFAGALSLVATIMHCASRPTPSLSAERQIRLFAALVCVMLAGVPFSMVPGWSFKVLFTQYINAIVFLIVFYKIVDSTEKLQRTLFVACMGSGTYCSFSLLNGELISGRLYFGEMFDPNDLAFFALAFIPVNLLFMSKQNRVIVRVVCLGLFLAGISLVLMSGSRGGLLALVLSSAILLFRSSRSIARKWKVIGVLMAASIAGMLTVNVERYSSLFEVSQDYNVTEEEGRLGIWKIGVRAAVASPILGVGVGCFANAVGLDRKERGADTRRWQTAHNSIIQIAAETGLIGMSLFLLLCRNVAKTLLGTAHQGSSENLARIGETCFAGFIGMFAASMFLSQAYSVLLVFYFALSAVVARLLRLQEVKAFAGTEQNNRMLM